MSEQTATIQQEEETQEAAAQTAQAQQAALTAQQETTKKKRNLERVAETEKARKIYEDLNVPNAGGTGYIDKFKPDKSEFAEVEVLPAFEAGLQEVHKSIQQAKDPADLAFNLMFGMLMGFLKSAENMLKQLNKTIDENNKIKRKQLQSYIDNNLKTNDSSIGKLSAELARYTQLNLLNDPRYAKLPAKGRNRLEKALISKRDFAASLPKKADGNINFDKMSWFQKRRYASYMTALAYSPTWYHYANGKCGIRLPKNTYKSIKDTAANLRNISVTANSR